ncbi:MULTISPECIES: ABC transporter permease [Streptosporangium]|uniref:ABC-2 type transport system permease protein n=1 Tax=Streptosporangium brasiliense TaxID=47480 RepID=A0ABT9QXB8_9ACTN|nr:ABC transporter permease [Streptosporangium brasiliense]MDP9861616.1 ABC-2 type transport system permease protein [Streptosporangium brasiliense]
MSARDLAVVTRFSGRLFWRDRTALSTSVLLFLGLGIGLPFMMDKVRPGHPEFLLNQHLGVLAMVLVLTTFNQIAVTLTARRDQLVLKRMRTTGLSDPAILGGEIGSLVVQSTLLTAVVSVALYSLTGLPAPRDPLLYLVFVVAGAAVLCLLGTAFTAIVPRTELAAVMAMPVFFLAGVGAGGFGPVLEILPGWVGTVLGLLPTGAVVEAAQAAYAADGTLAGDLRAAAVPALKLAVWGVAGLLATARWFRWETRRS